MNKIYKIILGLMLITSMSIAQTVEMYPVTYSNTVTTFSNVNFNGSTFYKYNGVTNQLGEACLNSVVISSTPTVSLTRAMGRYVNLDMITNTFLTVDTSSYPSNLATTFNLAIRLNGKQLTIDTNNIYGSTNSTFILSTNLWNSTFMHKGYGETIFTIRK